MKRDGFTLIELLLVCLIVPSLFGLMLLCLNVMKNIDLNLVNQADLFDVQIVQLLSRSKIETCESDLSFSKNKELYSLILDHSRIVKKPGFEILLFDVDELSFETYRNYCTIHYRYLEKMRKISVEIN